MVRQDKLLKEKDSQISSLQADLTKYVTELNEAEQYSRKNSMRINGLRTEDPSCTLDSTLRFLN